MEQRDAAAPGERRWSELASADPARWPLGRLLSAAARRVEREWNAHLDTWELNHASLPVLVLLMRAPHTQAELAQACEVTEQTMSRVLARMQRSGYIDRNAHATDRRKQQITITEAGRAVAFQAADPGPAEELVTRGLTDEQVATLRELLAIVAHPGPGPGRVDRGSAGRAPGRVAPPTDGPAPRPAQTGRPRPTP